MEKTTPAKPTYIWRGKRFRNLPAVPSHSVRVLSRHPSPTGVPLPWYQIAPSFQHLTVAPKRQPPGLFQGKGYFLQCVCEFYPHTCIKQCYRFQLGFEGAAMKCLYWTGYLQERTIWAPSCCMPPLFPPEVLWFCCDFAGWAIFRGLSISPWWRNVSVHVDSHHLFTNSLGAHCQAALFAAAENSLQTLPGGPLRGRKLLPATSCSWDQEAMSPGLAQASSGLTQHTQSLLLLGFNPLRVWTLGHLIFFLLGSLSPHPLPTLSHSLPSLWKLIFLTFGWSNSMAWFSPWN